MTLPAAVFASGRGSNFQVLAEHRTSLWEVKLLVSDREDAFVLERARRLGIAALHIPVSGRDPAEVADQTLEALSAAGIELVLLAGYMRLVPPAVVRRYRGRMLNLHPALLPSFGGKGMYGRHVHEAVLASGARISGVTVHLVDEEYDRGRITAQWPVPVLPDDTADTLAARIHTVEHRLYPAAADALARALRDDPPGAPHPIPGLGAGAAPGSREHFHLAPEPPSPDAQLHPEPDPPSRDPDEL